MKIINKIKIITSVGDASELNAYIKDNVRESAIKIIKLFSIHRCNEGKIEYNFFESDTIICNIVQRRGTIPKYSEGNRFKFLAPINHPEFARFYSGMDQKLFH